MNGIEQVNKLLQGLINRVAVGVNYLQIGDLVIQYGLISKSVPATSYANISVEFGKIYKERPVVVATLDASTNFPRYWNVCTKTITETYVDITLENTYTSAQQMRACWIAIGKILSGGGHYLKEYLASCLARLGGALYEYQRIKHSLARHIDQPQGVRQRRLAYRGICQWKDDSTGLHHGQAGERLCRKNDTSGHDRGREYLCKYAIQQQGWRRALHATDQFKEYNIVPTKCSKRSCGIKLRRRRRVINRPLEVTIPERGCAA